MNSVRLTFVRSFSLVVVTMLLRLFFSIVFLFDPFVWRSLNVFGVPECVFSRSLIGEYYSYENGLECHSSFRENGQIQRSFYRRESGSGATRKDSQGLLVNEDQSECFRLERKQDFFQLISRDKFVPFSSSLLPSSSLFLSFSLKISIVFPMFSILQSNTKCSSNEKKFLWRNHISLHKSNEFRRTLSIDRRAK